MAIKIRPCKILGLSESFTMSDQIQLPEPDVDALAHSARVVELIRERIAAADGWLDFADFMDSALYAPGLGYYSAGAQKFGESGDFTTAPEISPLFSSCIARALLGAGVAGGYPRQILELGAGTGIMAVDILKTLQRLDALPEQYLILEVSADLRERQQALLAEQVPDLFARIIWLDSLSDASVDGAIIANEVLDALPVSRFVIDGEGQPQLLGVVSDLNAFDLATRPATAALAQLAESLPSSLPAGFTSEWCPSLPSFIGALSGSLKRGMMLFVDYGVPRDMYYRPDRIAGTPSCHYRHRMHDDPFFYPGLQDITAWVDFTAVAESASAADLDVLYYMPQAHFLISAGIDQEFTRLADEFASDRAQQIRLSGGLKSLTLPGQMGENFKVLALGRDAVFSRAFSRSDQTHLL